MAWEKSVAGLIRMSEKDSLFRKISKMGRFLIYVEVIKFGDKARNGKDG